MTNVIFYLTGCGDWRQSQTLMVRKEALGRECVGVRESCPLGKRLIDERDVKLKFIKFGFISVLFVSSLFLYRLLLHVTTVTPLPNLQIRNNWTFRPQQLSSGFMFYCREPFDPFMSAASNEVST
uniref:Uncharacterized protein n=1 Tax=Strigamia maritima TaxID=126957 RepID=T1J501_STRMM